MKRFKLYIAVLSNYTKLSSSYTMLCVDKISELQAILPSYKDITIHVLNQNQLMRLDSNNDIKFQPIQIKVSEEIYNKILKEINKKVSYIQQIENQSIDIVFELNQLPVIQIIKNI